MNYRDEERRKDTERGENTNLRVPPSPRLRVPLTLRLINDYAIQEQ